MRLAAEQGRLSFEPGPPGTTGQWKVHLRRAPAATTDPITSHEAAAAVDASGIRAAQARHVLALVRASPGLTCGEYAERTHVLDRVQVARRLSDLKRAGVLRQGEPRASAGGSPRREVTWWLR